MNSYSIYCEEIFFIHLLVDNDDYILTNSIKF